MRLGVTYQMSDDTGPYQDAPIQFHGIREINSRARRWEFGIGAVDAGFNERIQKLSQDPGVKYIAYAVEGSRLRGYVHYGRLIFGRTVARVLSSGVEVRVLRGKPIEYISLLRGMSNFVEYGELPDPQGSRTDLKVAKSWVLSFREKNGRWPEDTEIATEFSTVFNRYPLCLKRLKETSLLVEGNYDLPTTTVV